MTGAPTERRELKQILSQLKTLIQFTIMTNNTNNFNNIVLGKEFFNSERVNRYDILTEKQKEALSRFILNPDHRPEGMDIMEIRYLTILPVTGSIVPRKLQVAATRKDFEDGYYGAPGSLFYILIEWEAIQLRADKNFYYEGDIYDTFDVRFVDTWDVHPDGTYELSWEPDPDYISLFIEDLLEFYELDDKDQHNWDEALNRFKEELDKRWVVGEDLLNSDTWQELVMEYFM